MGNHEYCTDCGANSYHHGEPCDPGRLAVMEEQRQKGAEARRIRHEDLKGLRTWLDAEGWDVIFNEYNELEVRGRKSQTAPRPSLGTLDNLSVPNKDGSYRRLDAGKDGVKSIEIVSYGFAEADPEFVIVYDDGRMESV